MYTLFVGDYAYSSWSLRGWLLLDAFGLDFDLRYARLKTPEFNELTKEMAPSKLVPSLAISEGDGGRTVVWDSLAIAETLNERHPDASFWPADPAARAVARATAAEMHSGFSALRAECPMNLRRAYAGFVPSDAVRADLVRLSEIWAQARNVAAEEGPYLFGPFTITDAFFAPVASRIRTYGLEMPPEDRAHITALLEHPSFERWEVRALQDEHIQPQYEFDLPERTSTG